MKNFAAAAILLAAASTAASAATYDFSYEFDSGLFLEGVLEGTLQGDNDTINVEDFGTVTLNGIALPDIDPTEIASVSDFNNNALQPVVSLSGSVMDVFVCALGFNTNNNCGFANEGGFFMSTGGNTTGVFAGDGNFFTASSAFYAANWSIALANTAAIPLPATLPLGLGALALIGLVGIRQRRQDA
jgi:hypothetical protein